MCGACVIALILNVVVDVARVHFIVKSARQMGAPRVDAIELIATSCKRLSTRLCVCSLCAQSPLPTSPSMLSCRLGVS